MSWWDILSFMCFNTLLAVNKIYYNDYLWCTIASCIRTKLFVGILFHYRADEELKLRWDVFQGENHYMRYPDTIMIIQHILSKNVRPRVSDNEPTDIPSVRGIHIKAHILNNQRRGRWHRLTYYHTPKVTLIPFHGNWGNQQHHIICRIGICSNFTCVLCNKTPCLYIFQYPYSPIISPCSEHLKIVFQFQEQTL